MVGKRPRALVVDRRPRTRQMMVERLRAMGFEVAEADGEASVDLQLRAHRPDLVITDWAVEGIGGLRLLDRLGPRERTVILFTEEALEDYPDLLARTSVRAWFHKKERGALMEKVRRSLEPRVGGAHSPRKIILLVEASARLRGFLRVSLMGALPQAALREAEDGVQALAWITHQPVDLIFLDMDSPTLDGRAFLRMVHGDPRLALKPIVVLAGRVTPDLLREFKDDRAVWFIEKPAQAEEVVEVAGRFLRHED